MVVIHPEAWRVILEHVTTCYPEEGCGILAGRTGAGPDDALLLAAPCDNVTPSDRRTRFLMHPEQILQGLALARGMRPGEPLELAGFFHSHPDREPYFSETDRTESWRGCIHVVISVRQGVPVSAACYRRDGATGQVSEEPLDYSHAFGGP